MKKTGRRKKKEEGLVLKFDPEERKEFLTGFRKRKLQRGKGSKSKNLNKQTIFIQYEKQEIEPRMKGIHLIAIDRYIHVNFSLEVASLAVHTYFYKEIYIEYIYRNKDIFM